MSKVTFDYTNRLIICNSGVTEIDVRKDLYSYAKTQWQSDPVLNKFLFLFRVVGGDTTVGSNSVSPYFFLQHGWKLRPQEASHTLQIAGTLLVDGGGDPYVSTLGTFNVRIVATVPIVAEFIVAQLPEIQFASFQNAVWYESGSGTSGTMYPAGTRQYPVDNIPDAVAILAVQGFGRLGLLSDVTFGSGHNIEDLDIFGLDSSRNSVVIEAASQTMRCRFVKVQISGTLDGQNVLEYCLIKDIDYINGTVLSSMLCTQSTIHLQGGASATFIDCTSAVAENVGDYPTIDMGGSGQALGIRNYNGMVKLVNKTGPELCGIDLNSGHVVIDSTVTGGVITVRGVGKVTNNGTATLIDETVGSDTVHTIEKLVGNRVVRIDDVITIYEDDGVTVWRQYDLANGSREPI
jgi:hypothetical protein